MEMYIPPRRVPCGTCTACCETERVYMHPECGDDPTEYLTQWIGHRIALAQAENVDCIYLVRGEGCSIHDRRPSMCREFDCRTLLRLSDEEIDTHISSGVLSQIMIDAARRLRAATREKVCPTIIGRRKKRTR